MLPKVMPHTWRAYGDDPIRFQVTVTPGEFETFFERIVERKLTLRTRLSSSRSRLLPEWTSSARH